MKKNNFIEIPNVLTLKQMGSIHGGMMHCGILTGNCTDFTDSCSEFTGDCTGYTGNCGSFTSPESRSYY